MSAQCGIWNDKKKISEGSKKVPTRQCREIDFGTQGILAQDAQKT